MSVSSNKSSNAYKLSANALSPQDNKNDVYLHSDCSQSCNSLQPSKISESHVGIDDVLQTSSTRTCLFFVVTIANTLNMFSTNGFILLQSGGTTTFIESTQLYSFHQSCVEHTVAVSERETKIKKSKLGIVSSIFSMGTNPMINIFEWFGPFESYGIALFQKSKIHCGIRFPVIFPQSCSLLTKFISTL